MFESIPWQVILIAFGTGLFRSLAGWLENAFEDKHVSPYELAQLGATIIRVFLETIAIYLPLQSLGVNSADLAAAGSALVFDKILLAVKKQKKLVIEDTPTTTEQPK